MEQRRLGRLGHKSSVLIYGGAALAEVDQTQADESISLAIDAGINHFDTSDDYGESELRLGPWMARIRDDIFLATKTTVPSRQAAADTIRRSLERLQVETVDLIQLHGICTVDELDVVTRSGGALEALVAARDEGLVGGIGITGHGRVAAATHHEALRRFPFDTILTPYSYRLWREEDFRRDFSALLEEIRAQDVGLMLIKHVARNLWPEGGAHRYATWYEPLDEQRHIDAAVAFALGLKEATGLCTAGDVRLLPLMVEAERRAESLSAQDIDAVLAEVDEYESPFVWTEGREVPDWLHA